MAKKVTKKEEVKKPKVVKKEEAPKVEEEVKVEEALKEEKKEESKIPVQPRICEFEDTCVVKVLEDRHTPTEYHCYCEDGSTRHVPRELIDKQ